jgi:hypothetical protein
MSDSHTRQTYSGETMKFNSMQHIPLASAYLCPNCSCIGNCSVRCPACASSALLGLAGILDRNAEDNAQISFAQVHALAA